MKYKIFFNNSATNVELETDITIEKLANIINKKKTFTIDDKLIVNIKNINFIEVIKE